MNALVPVNTPAMSVSDVERVALAIAKGGLFGSKDPNAVLTLCLLAQAEGQHPAVVFRDYHLINGKPAKKAEAMLRDFITAGGKIEWHTLDDECADATFTHSSGGSARIAWDMPRVEAAKLGGNAMYKKYPRQMLRSRTISEGVRTVFPGATSGMYVPEEVTSFDGGTDEGNPQTGEVIEARAEKVPGITKIKERLRALQTAGDKPETDLAALNALIHDAADDLTKIRGANHSWWTGDGEDFEGFRAWIIRRRAELAEDGQFSMLVKSMKDTFSAQQLTNWMAANESMIAKLEDEERSSFELAYNLHASGLQAVAALNAG